MLPKAPLHKDASRSVRMPLGAVMLMTLVAALVLPGVAFGQDASGTTTATCGFLGTVSVVLNSISVVVVTIAIIFTGYKVAFAHARISEVAPVLIGAVLIGAASQIAKIFLASSSSSNGATACTPGGGTATGMIIMHAVDHYAALVHVLTHYA